MVNPMKADAVLEREFLEIRAKILELAASFDRLDRGGAASDDLRTRQITEAIRLLDFDGEFRAEKVQFIFSREYEDDWREKYGLA